MPNLTLPGYNYLGPGNPIDNGDPVNDTDRIAQLHDIAYSQAKTEEDIRHSDRVAIRDFFVNSVIGNYQERNASLIGAIGLSTKYLFETVKGEVVYPSMKRVAEADSTTGHKKHSGDNEMDIDDNVAGDVDPASMAIENGTPARNGGGSGNSGGNGGGQTAIMYMPMPQTQEWCDYTFRKTYRFHAATSPPQFRRATVVTAGNNSQYMDFKPGSMFSIPVHYAFAYLSPQEYAFLCQFPMVKTKSVNCTFNSLGIRLPFVTNEAAAMTANASAQIPVYKMSNSFSKYNLLSYDTAQLEDTRSKMNGASPSGWTAAGTGVFNPTFPNISARATSRRFQCDTILRLYKPVHHINGLTVDSQVFYGDPSIHEFKEICLNGTTNLGPIFNYSYKPVNNTLCAVTTTQIRTGAAHNQPNDDITAVGIGKVNVMRDQTNPVSIDGTISYPTHVGAAQDMIPGVNLPYEQALIENPNLIDAKKEFHNHRQPHFCVGIEFLRNADDTLLHSVWEFVLEYSMTVSVRQKTTGLYTLDTGILPSQNMFPSYVPGNYGTRGTASTTATDGWRVQTNAIDTSIWWNQPAANMITVPQATAPQPTAVGIGPTTRSKSKLKKLS